MPLIALLARVSIAAGPSLALPPDGARLAPVKMSEADLAGWWQDNTGGARLSAEEVAGDWRVRAVFNPHGRSMMAGNLIEDDPWSDLAFSPAGVCRRGRQVHACPWMADPSVADPTRWVFARWEGWVVALAPDAVRELHHSAAPVESLVVLERLSAAPSHLDHASMGPGSWPPDHVFRRMTPPLPLWEGEEAQTCRIGLGVSGSFEPTRLADPVLLDVWGCPEPAAALVRGAIGCWRLRRPAGRSAEGDGHRIWYVETVVVDPEALSDTRRCPPR